MEVLIYKLRKKLDDINSKILKGNKTLTETHEIISQRASNIKHGYVVVTGKF